jgi:hypothetical protein
VLPEHIADESVDLRGTELALAERLSVEKPRESSARIALQFILTDKLQIETGEQTLM